VQAYFLALMLTGGTSPCLPDWPISKIKLQGRRVGYETDDLIVFVVSEDGRRQCKLLGQIRHSIHITKGDTDFLEVIGAAWRDFNNTALFVKGQDAIALMTGPLSKSEVDSVRPIFDRARVSEGHAEYFNDIDLGIFTSDDMRNRIFAFREAIKLANDGQPASDEMLFLFLKHFYLLGFDLDSRTGIMLSLIESLIGREREEPPGALWARLVEEVHFANKNAGTIKLESLSEGLRAAFSLSRVIAIPEAITARPIAPPATGRSEGENVSALAIAILLGSWREGQEQDTSLAALLACEEYSIWITKIREALHAPESSFVLSDGRWRVADRLNSWRLLGARLYDDTLVRFKTAAELVLSEKDPKFELPPDQRFGARVMGKDLSYSSSLRNGLAETLALLGNHPESLIHCTRGTPEATAARVIHTLLENADWVLWASLNDLLPLLAEASPSAFLDAVEKTLGHDPCPFDAVFAQEGDGISAGNFMTGLLWALETLAWDPNHLGRAVLCLGELATRDPGGSYANRPINSLTKILLPWHPQTCAPTEKRYAVVGSLCKELPEIGWNLLMSLLPGANTLTMDSRRPSWRQTIPDNWTISITKVDYQEQVSHYSELAVAAAKGSVDKLIELIDILVDLSPPLQEQLLSYLESDPVLAFSDTDRLNLWEKLVQWVAKHRKYSEAEWAAEPQLIERVASLAEKLTPVAPAHKYRRLFSKQDHELYEDHGDHDAQHKALEARREKAIEEIAGQGGVSAVFEFASQVAAPSRVGAAYGGISDDSVDSFVLPSLLESADNSLVQFATGYVRGKFYRQLWPWVDRVDTSGWTPAQIGQFFAWCPFLPEAWERAERLLGSDESIYWNKTHADPFPVPPKLEHAVDRLIQYGRPNAAIRCLWTNRQGVKTLDRERAIRALMAAVTHSNSNDPIDAYESVELIKALQNDVNTVREDLFKVEWAYLSLLDRHHGAVPTTLELRLANIPEFFCKVIRLVYRSRKQTEMAIDSAEKQTESNADRQWFIRLVSAITRLIYRSKTKNQSVIEETPDRQGIATNAYRLLRQWSTPPGSQKDGSFDGDQLREWLKKVSKECTGTGHLEVAMSVIGQVLIHAPQDPDKLWIHRSAAAVLDAKDAGDMRIGFRIGLHNSRGVHWVDPTGKPEYELAAKYRIQADAVETAGFARLASTVRELADDYQREAESRLPNPHDD
jgi:hypothetical protein